jgi:O-antigen ligase
MLLWVAYGLMSAALASAVLLRGGVYPQQWVWSALGVSVAALIALASGSEAERPQSEDWTPGLMGMLLGYMALQMVPLPPALVAFLSPERWNAVAAARTATGLVSEQWVSISVAPAATFERLLYVVAAMATFAGARELTWRWRGRTWAMVAPVVAIAWLESMLGLAQFHAMRMNSGDASAATGTYVNRNHFAGLLEMALPLAVMGGVAVWRKGNTRHSSPAWAALAATALFGVGVCLLAGIVVSLSRMAFISALAGVALAASILLGARTWQLPARNRIWRAMIPAALILFLLVFLPTKELVNRFAELASSEQISKDLRLGIWKDTLHLIAAYKWTGCGLGAYERGLFKFKTVAPMNAVDFAHNDYLQILAELGVMGALLAMALALRILWRAFAVALRKPNDSNWELAVGLLVTLLIMGLHSLADFNLYIPANALALAWLGGVADSPGLRES